ncbi:MAG: hypothetical protein ABI054_03250 [Planctomycetota bacterium]
MASKAGSRAGPAVAASAAWVAALQDAFADVEWVDSELDLGEGRSVDWVGIDPSGRVVLAMFCEGTGEVGLVSALDALVFFERNRPVLAQHLRSPRVRTALEPIVALIAQSFSEQLLGRLCVLGASNLRILELRQLSSSRGERAYLVPLAPSIVRNAPEAPHGPEAFLSALPVGRRTVGELLIKRISRIDTQLVLSSGERSLFWRLGEDLLCSIALIEGVVEGQIPPLEGPRLIADAAEVEVFVDRVLERYVAILGSGPLTSSSSDSPMFAAVDAGMTLTPEEIAAFRQSG